MIPIDEYSRDTLAADIERLKALFPQCVSDGKVDFDVLRQVLGDAVESSPERYSFVWNGKASARAYARQRSAGTLRPLPTKSVGADGTPGAFDSRNVYIEGDNLEVLKLLQGGYHAAVKMIYIDPPYNTGHDFVYADDFRDSIANYKAVTGQTDEEGHALRANAETSGRFHTDWLNMLFPRLILARNLLAEDGVIFVSIDDNEQDNLKKMMNEVFGEENFIAQLVWERAYAPKNDARFVSNSHDYVLMYARNITDFAIGRLPRTEDANARYVNLDNDPRGVWKPSDLSVKTYSAASDYPITLPSGRVVEPPTGRCWSLSAKAFAERLRDNRIWFGPNGDSTPCLKRFLSELKFDGMAPTSIMHYKDVGHSQEGAQEVTKLLDAGVFDGPKPVRLLRRLLTLANTKEDSLVLDFFSGSGTTAHAVMELNAEDGGKRRYICVQLPEPCAAESEAGKAGYDNLCSIGEERLRRSGSKIRSESGLYGQDLDTGFRCFRLDSSNVRRWNPAPEDLRAELFESLESILPGRTSEDLLYEVLLKCNLPLDLPVEERIVTREGAEAHLAVVGAGTLVACLDESIPEWVADEIVQLRNSFAPATPMQVVFRESGFRGENADKLKTNVLAPLDQHGFPPEAIRSI